MAVRTKQSFVILASLIFCVAGITFIRYKSVVRTATNFPSADIFVQGATLGMSDGPNYQSPPAHVHPAKYDVFVSSNITTVGKVDASSTAQIRIDNLAISSISIAGDGWSKNVDDRMTPLQQQVLRKARRGLRDGSTGIRLEMPGVEVAPKETSLGAWSIVLLIRANENKDARFEGALILDTSTKDMRYSLDTPEVTMVVLQHYSVHESINWIYTFLGSAFTLSGLLGFFSSRLIRKKSNEPMGTA